MRLARCSIMYWCRLAPQARVELRHWHQHAQALPDHALRHAALTKLQRESLNAEAAAFIALLSRDTGSAVRRIVAFEVLYELLDVLSEGAPLADGMVLHDRLLATLHTTTPPCDSYTAALLDACRMSPSIELREAIRVVCEAQSHNHAPDGRIRAWSEAQGGYGRWWETAAAGIACLSVHALFASPPEHHPGLTQAYMGIDALGSLLDAVRDLPSDLLDGNHNFIAHYASDREMTHRLVQITSDSLIAIRGLPGEEIHRMVLAGLLAYNLSALPGHRDLRRDAGRLLPLVRVGLFAMRLRRAHLPTRRYSRGVLIKRRRIWHRTRR
jgi:hypothetical protein